MNYDFNASDYFFVINLINISIVILMLPYLIKKAYSNNFNLEKDHILYTAPLSLKTIFFYKFITANNKFVLAFIFTTIPNIILYGTINKYSVVNIIVWILSLIVLLLLASTLVQLITVISAAVIKEKYRRTIINIISSSISALVFILFLFFQKIYSLGEFLVYLKDSYVISKEFFPFELWRQIAVNTKNIEIYPICILIAISVCIIFIFFYLYKFIYLKGAFIGSSTDNGSKLKGENNILYYLLKKIFRNSYILIYKDLLIFARSIEKWGVILSPIVFTPLPFLNGNLRDYITISEILILLFLWLSSELAFYAVKSEGAMLKHLKNSSFNITNIIYSKVAFASILSIFIYIIINIVLCILLRFTFYQLLIWDIGVVSMVLATSTICTSLGMLYAKESREDNGYKVNISISGELLTYLFMIIIDGIIVIVSMLMLYSSSIIESNLLLLISNLLLSGLMIILVILFMKYFVKRVSEKFS